MSLRGKIAMVTGGASGLGKAFSEGLLERGAKVFVVDRNETTGKTVESELQGKYGKDSFTFQAADVTDNEAMKKIHFRIVEQCGGIDILINCAAIGVDTERTIRVNTLALIEIGEMVMAHMRKDKGGKGGVIINVGSGSGLLTDVGEVGTAYFASKTAVVSYTSVEGGAMPDEAAVKMVSLNPVFVDTPMTVDYKREFGKGTQYVVDCVKKCGGWVDKSLVVDACMKVVENPSSVAKGASLLVNQENTYVVDFHLNKTPIDKELLSPLGNDSLKGKVAMVTGGARGLGKGFSEGMLQRGAKVIFLDISPEVAQATEQEFREKYGQDAASFKYCDVTNMEKVNDVKNWILEQYGGLDIVINNAGGNLPQEPVPMIGLYLLAPLLTTDMAMKHMRKDKGGKGGTIINISSSAGVQQVVAAVSLYHGAKHGLAAYTQNMADTQSADTGVNLFCLCPSNVDTALTKTVREMYDQGIPVITDMVEKAGGWVDLSRVVDTCMMCLERPSALRKGTPMLITQDEIYYAVRTPDKTPLS